MEPSVIDYNTVTTAQRLVAREDFLNFAITKEETYLNIKQRYNELPRKITVQRGVMNEVDILETLLTALPMKHKILCESYFAQKYDFFCSLTRVSSLRLAEFDVMPRL